MTDGKHEAGCTSLTQELLRRTYGVEEPEGSADQLIQEICQRQLDLEVQNEDLRETRQLLERARDSYQRLYDFAPVGFFTCDTDDRITDSNATFAGMLGLSRGALLGTPFDYFASEESLDTYRIHSLEVRKGEGEKSCIISLRRQDGSLLLADMKSGVERICGEVRVCSALVDITDRKQAEDRLKLAGRAIETAVEGIVISDRECRILDVNPAFETITGYASDEVQGRHVGMLRAAGSDDHLVESIRQHLAESGSWKGRLYGMRRNGEIFPAHMSVSVIRGRDGGVSQYVGVFSDISEQSLFEKQLRQAQKMEAIGTLVGGIAHDFNNLLAGITGNVYLARRINGDDARLTSKLDNIDRLSMRAAGMISQMLAFSRKGIVRVKHFRFDDFIREAVRLAGLGLPEDIGLRLDIQDRNLWVRGDDTQLRQVIMNLVRNACDALSDTEDPEILLTVSSYTPESGFLRHHPELSGKDMVCCRVHDNGSGISPEHIGRIFDPFFTTKEVGMGTGLGLAMCYGSVSSHRGAIDVQSRPGEGCTFSIFLPLAAPGEGVEEAREAGVSEAGRGETLLFADDESDLRETIGDALESMGYEVLLAADGRQAMDLFVHQQPEIRLAILDVVMPGMDGRTLAGHMRQANPGLPVLFVSGYDHASRDAGGDPANHTEHIVKPFDLAELGRTVRRMLDEAREKQG